MKKNRKIKTNKYSFGTDGVWESNWQKNNAKSYNATSTALNVVGGIGNMFNGGNQKAQALISSIGGVAQDIGGLFGPAGSAIAGAATGLAKGVTALIGDKGSVDPATGEIDYGSGIKGKRNEGNLIRESRLIKEGIAQRQYTSAAQEEYANERGDNDYSLAAYGGILPTTLAYLDDGELMRTPDGEISQIPEQGKPTDSNLVNVPVGTQVLSDKLKVPGTSETFAQVGKKYMKTGKKKGNDIYAQNSQMLNDRNNQKKYNELLALQEQVKAKRGIKNKVGKYATGTLGLPEPVTSADDRDEMNELFIRVNPNYNSNISHDRNRAVTSWYKSADANAYKQAGESIRTFLKNKANYDNAYKTLSGLPQIQKNLKTGMSFEDAVIKNVSDGLYGQVHDYFDISSTPFDTPVQRPTSTVSYNINVPIAGQNRTSTNTVGNTTLKTNYNYTGPGKINIPRNNTNPTSDETYGTMYDKLGDILSNSAAFIGPLTNIFNGDPEQTQAYVYTPHYAPVDYDISPLIRQIDLNTATSRYNMANINPNTGANLAYGIQSAMSRNKAIANAYNYKNNVETQRKATNAGIYNDAARYNANAMHTADVENAQNRAAARNVRNTGFSQLGTALQSMSRDKRLNKRDQAMLEYMKEFFNYGSTQDTVNKLYRNFR